MQPTMLQEVILYLSSVRKLFHGMSHAYNLLARMAFGSVDTAWCYVGNETMEPFKRT
jgi:hypothetical protein